MDLWLVGGEKGRCGGGDVYFVLVEWTVGGDVGHSGMCMCGCWVGSMAQIISPYVELLRY